MDAKRFWLFLHRWLGLVIGFHIVIIGLTGSFLVFHRDIDQYLNPLFYQPISGTSIVGVNEALHRLEEKTGVKTHYVFNFIRANAHEPIRFERELENGDLESSSINPVSGELIGRRIFSKFFTSFIYELHYEMFLGGWGQLLVGISGIFTLLLLVTGVYLWWPKGSFWSGFTIKSATSLMRSIFELHRLSGIYSLIVIAWISISGLYLVFPQQFTSGVKLLSTVQAAREFKSTKSSLSRITIDTAIAKAKEAEPNAVFTGLVLPDGAEDSFRIGFREIGAVGMRLTTSYLWLDQYTGKLLGKRLYQNLPVGSKFISWQHQIHTGEIFHLSGRILVFIAGFIPLFLYISGCYLWWKRRRKRLFNGAGDRVRTDDLLVGNETL